jgi:hypothetical protein
MIVVANSGNQLNCVNERVCCEELSVECGPEAGQLQSTLDDPDEGKKSSVEDRDILRSQSLYITPATLGQCALELGMIMTADDNVVWRNGQGTLGDG